MRTNIEIDDSLLAEAMKAGPYQSKREAVEAGLRLLARQAAYREILKWEGRLKWDGGEGSDWTAPAGVTRVEAHEPGARRRRAGR
jgi:antitoxin ParD1/3/4